MAYKINGGTLYPMNTGSYDPNGYDITPEEQALIEIAMQGRNVNYGPEQSISNAFTMQDIYSRALQEKALNDQLYLQRIEDERKKRLAEEDMAMQEQSAQADFGRTAKLIKAKELAGVVQQQAGNPNMMTNPDMAALAGELDAILGTNQPKNTGVIYKSKSGKYFNVPGMGNEDKTEGRKSLAERIKARNAAKQTQAPPPSPAEPEKTVEDVLSKGNKPGESPANLFSIIYKLFQEGNVAAAKEKIDELEAMKRNVGR